VADPPTIVGRASGAVQLIQWVRSVGCDVNPHVRHEGWHWQPVMRLYSASKHIEERGEEGIGGGEGGCARRPARSIPSSAAAVAACVTNEAAWPPMLSAPLTGVRASTSSESRFALHHSVHSPPGGCGAGGGGGEEVPEEVTGGGGEGEGGGWVRVGEFHGGGGDGAGGGGECAEPTRVPQSTQSSPNVQAVYSAPWPPSSQSLSDA
jgi:hypothetical protein